MTGKKLDQYKGPLSPSQIAEGMNAAAANAKRLQEDAKTLLDAKRYPTALSLAVLSIEESGKLSILRGLALARDQDDLKQAWREYRSHTRKNVMWLFLDLFKHGARRLGDFRSLFAEDSEHAHILDNVKQLGFYTDCLGKAHWSLPVDVIDADLSRAVVEIAKLLLPKREVTTTEIDSWIKHLKPVWKQDTELVEAAIVAWHREMCNEGLADEDPDTMERFILEGVQVDPRKQRPENGLSHGPDHE
jgi:AbiV family abortive infection protein